MAKTATINIKLADREEVKAAKKALTDEVHALRSVLYNAICGTSDDPAEYGVTLDHQNGVAILGDQDECDQCHGEGVVGVCSAHQERDDGCETCDRPMTCPACGGNQEEYDRG